jgi:biopolymer transport protein ExbD
MKVPSSYSHFSERAEVAMTPMIDVVFLLLIFFLWTSSFQAIETLLPSQLTARGGGAGGGEGDLLEEDFEQIVIRITSRPNGIAWHINGQPVASLAELQSRLRSLSSIKPDLPVIIDPAEDVPFGPVIDVYDTSLGVGCSNIQFTTRAELLASPSSESSRLTP